MVKYVIGFLAVTCVAAGISTYYFAARANFLASQNDILEKNLSLANTQVELARDAQAVAEAYATSFRKKAEEYDELRETLLKGDFEDAPIPDWFNAFLDRLLNSRVPPDNP